MFIFWFVAYMMTVSLLFLHVICVYAVYGELIPILPFYLPVIDDTTYAGYITLFMLHITAIFFAVIGYVMIEFLLTVMVVGSLIFANLISMDVRKADDELQLADPIATFRLRNIILMHQESSEYETIISETKKRILLQFF